MLPSRTHWLRRLVLSTPAVCATLVIGAAPSAAADRDVPTGIRQSLRESGNVLVSAVAADIDADGDLDVVATDGSLNLLVFVNDGQGQYTRKQPAPRREEHTESPAPGVESHEPFTDVYTSAAPSPLDVAVRAASFDRPASLAHSGLGPDPAIERAVSRRRPRGPPSGASLI